MSLLLAGALLALLRRARRRFGWRGLLRDALEAVAVLVHRAKAPARLGVEAELGAQLAGVGVDGARADLGANAPHGVEKIRARQQPADAAEQEHRHLELLLRELDAAPRLSQGTAVRIDAELAGLDRLLGVAAEGARAAQQ